MTLRMNDFSKNRISTERQREILSTVASLIADRAERETSLRSALQQSQSESEEKYCRNFEELKNEFERESKELDAAYVKGLEKARHRYEVDIDAIKKECSQQKEEAETKCQEAVEAAELNWRQTRALCIENFEHEKQSADEIGEQSRQTLAGYEEQFSWLEQRAEKMLKRRRVKEENPPPEKMSTEESTAQLVKRYSSAASLAHQQLEDISSWKLTRYLDEGWTVLLFFAALVAAIYPFGKSFGWTNWMWAAASVGTAAVVAMVTHQVIHSIVRGRAKQPLATMQSAVVDARDAVSRANVTVEREHEQRHRRLERRHQQQLQQADDAWEKISSDLKRELSERVDNIAHRLSAAEKQLETRWDEEARPFREEFPPKIEARKEKFQTDSEALAAMKQAELDAAQAEFDRGWSELCQEYSTRMGQADSEVEKMSEYCESRFPALDSVDWSKWKPTTDTIPALKFGEFDVDLNDFEGGLSNEEGLALEIDRWKVPAVLSFPESPSLLIKATDEGRDEATRVLRNVMLRLLTSFPAGKVRFTIIDPTGLGQNFSEFMHLADFDERLVGVRIWTEQQHINQRLADLTEHMENVIQKYLRNEFESIQAYNAAAGEVAEPFQVLVIANFPANFPEETARRLVSIAKSGARCGVYTLISADMKMGLPRNFDLADLETEANTLVWDDGKFRWQLKDLEPFSLNVDTPVEGDTLTELVRAAGEHAKDANRVEVPFEAVVPKSDDWWTWDSRNEITVPLGRAGATKLQSMNLGKGTSQHVLISGKTGSGKSTLMHAMITNLAIHYSPRELEFFLVDFKKGVEFKTYAQFELPHARVIAIESEREFGMSVLQRLDDELKRRGDIFRDVGVQGLAGFRDARPEEFMPRQLLIVDEFQEFFVKDDKLAQDASLLLDRLVRQGRAFGIHVLLGSQTLAGAYSLARSTLGQMAVRIALQCSEADAHLILSEDNTAARLLSRPGEAIYNNANGLFEGNHPFQVVWLPDSRREDFLRDIQTLSESRGVEVPPAIVFEGNVAASPASNTQLCKSLSTVPSKNASAAPRTWFGSAIAIKEPTHAILRRQGGNNLLVVGQKEEMAAGVMSSALISLAAQQPPQLGKPECRDARLIVFDGGGFEAEEIMLGARMAKRLPLNIENVEATDVEEMIASVSKEVTERMESKETGQQPIYLAIYNLARFRQLRKSDDDYGLGSFGDDDEKSASQHLAHIISEGPAVGIHVLMWCDTYNNVTRWFERATMRDIAHRVLFQMSATDSSNLMDSAAASQLGTYRAIYYDDEQGEFERFRPYGAPTNEWFGQASELLRSTPPSSVRDSDPVA